MSAFLFSLITCLSFIIPMQAHIKDLTTLHLDHLSLEPTECESLSHYIHKQQPTFIYALSADKGQLYNFYEHQLQTLYPHVYEDNSSQELCIFSQLPLEHLKVDHFDAHNFLIEISTSELSALILHGHLPHLTPTQIDTLKSYLIASNPYTSLHMMGDLNYTTPYTLSPWQLCVRGQYEVSVSTDKEGNKSAQAECKISTDDGRLQVSGEVKVSKDDNGQSNAEGTIRVEGSF